MLVTLSFGKQLSEKDINNITYRYYTVNIDDDLKQRIEATRQFVDDLTNNGKIVYGINTGFGSLSETIVDNKDIEQLQINLIKSHAIGTGESIDIHIVRLMMLFRLQCFCQCHSGVSMNTVNMLIDALNKNFIPQVFTQGSVGASGDLVPLSHMTLGLMGFGNAYDKESNTYIDANIVLEKLNMKSLILKSKEGLALNNGTQFITANLYHALQKAHNAFNYAVLIGAMTFEVLHGTKLAFDENIHESKPHEGQIHVASMLRNLLSDSEIDSGNKVQDAYSLRCQPQILGPVYDELCQIKNTVLTEINSANDNPLIFDYKILSGGNFHGMYIALAADKLALIMSIVCNLSERRLERIVNPDLNKFLPKFLAKNSGLNSGCMIMQYASASITAENRQLANPACIHNIPTSCGQEDIVSMGAWCARKANQVVDNTVKVLAYELLTAYYASFYTKEKYSTSTQKFIDQISELGINELDEDRYMKPDLDKVIELIIDNA